MKPSRHDDLKRAVSESAVCGETALVEAVGILVTASADVRCDLGFGRVEMTQQVTARRLRALFDELAIPTRLVVEPGGGRRSYTVYGLNFAPMAERQALLQACVSPEYLRSRCIDPAQARALWRGVLLASQPQRRRMPGFAVAVRDVDLARLLVEIAKVHLAAGSAHRAAAPPGTRVVVDDVADAERIVTRVLTDQSHLITATSIH
jgi:hypothetical protein